MMKKLGFCIAGLALTVGCGTAPTTPAKSTKKASDTTTGTQFASSRNMQMPQIQECPATEKVWRQEQTRQLLAHANKCALLGKWAQVEAIGNHLAKKEANEPWGAYYLSLSAQAQKNYPRAIWMIDLALRKSPDNAQFIYQRGRIHWDSGEYTLAVKSFEKAVKIDSTLVDANLILGQVYFRDQDYKGAVDRFQAVLRKEDSNLSALTGMSEAQLKLGKNESAVALLEQAIDASPGNIAFRLRLAGLYETVMKDPAKALSAYRKVQTLIAENRGLRSEVSFDLSKKISALESQVAKSDLGEKVSQKETAKKAKVKK